MWDVVWRQRSAILVLSTLMLGLVTSATVVAAAVHRNFGNYLLVQELNRHSGPCEDIPVQEAGQHLESALRLGGETLSAWRTLLRIRGWSDRRWIIEQLKRRPEADTYAQAIQRAAQTLVPPVWAMREPWTEERCRAAWDAWTLGLVEAASGRWQQAVAAYQAGLSVAPGRVPTSIGTEYYLSLARYILSAENVSPSQKLAVAKYLVLAKEDDEARLLLQSLSARGALVPSQRCDTQRWLDWVQQSAAGVVDPPPAPASRQEYGGICQREAGVIPTSDPDWSPDWVLSLDNPANSPAESGVLLGFDVDTDILEAGLEVMGTLYWQHSDGRIQSVEFREPNLWPNSGSSWLPLEGFTICLPGYQKAPMNPCIGGTVWTEGVDTDGWVGYVRLIPAQEPEFISTASVPLSSDVPVVYGGWWRIEGDLPRAHVAQYGVAEDPTHPYQVVLPLNSLPVGSWQRSTSVVASPTTADYSGWIRPRMGIGEGSVVFDQVFGFVLPVWQKGSP